MPKIKKPFKPKHPPTDDRGCHGPQKLFPKPRLGPDWITPKLSRPVPILPGNITVLPQIFRTF